MIIENLLRINFSNERQPLKLLYLVNKAINCLGVNTGNCREAFL